MLRINPLIERSHETWICITEINRYWVKSNRYRKIPIWHKWDTKILTLLIFIKKKTHNESSQVISYTKVKILCKDKWQVTTFNTVKFRGHFKMMICETINRRSEDEDGPPCLMILNLIYLDLLNVSDYKAQRLYLSQWRSFTILE